MDLPERARSENFPRGAGDLEAMADVAQGLLARQRHQVIAPGNALRELPQVVAIQEIAQFRLSDQDDLQQLLGRRFEVGEEAHLFQRFRRQILRLIDDHDDPAALGVRRQEPLIQRIHHVLHAFAVGIRDRHPEFLADGLQELHGREARIENHGHVGVMRHPRQQRSHDGGLAGADFAGQLDEAAGFVDAVEQMRQRFGVPLAQIEVARVGGDREGLFAEPEEA